MQGNTSRKAKADANAEAVRQGATLRTIRELRGLKLGELANRLEVSYSYLSNIEAGRKRLTPQLVARAAAVLAVPQIALVADGHFIEGAA